MGLTLLSISGKGEAKLCILAGFHMAIRAVNLSPPTDQHCPNSELGKNI